MPKPDWSYRVRRSTAGLGLFACREFQRGETIIEYTGEIISDAEANRRGGRYLFRLNRNWVIDGSTRSNVARYINHSCRPNAYAELSADEQQVHIIAKRRIAPEEEITYHYGKEYVQMYITPHGCRCQACQVK